MNAPEAAAIAAPAAVDPFVTIPATTLPDGRVVPAFRVSRYVCTQGADGKLAITAEGTPWVRLNFEEAKAACEAAGYRLITESQWLAIAHQLASQDANWTQGRVGAGKLFRGIRKGDVHSAQPGSFEPASRKERRWMTLPTGERLCDMNGNVYSWIFDDVQGDAAGLTGVIKADSPSLQAPFPSMEKGMGWRPDGECDWSGYALIRGGYWCSEADAGVFDLNLDWPGYRGGRVGFRCTTTHGL